MTDLSKLLVPKGPEQEKKARRGRPASKSLEKGFIRAVNEVADDLVFLPSPEQRRVKSAFWASVADNPMLDPAGGTITVSQATRITGEGRLSRWWKLPGFEQWFLNKDEFRQRVEYLANLALDVAEEILLDRSAHPSARVNMTKLIVEVANKIPSRAAQKDENRYLDAQIAKMSRDELAEFIDKNTKFLGISSESDKPSAEGMDSSDTSTEECDTITINSQET